MANKDEKINDLLVLAKQGDEAAVNTIVDSFVRRANALANRLLYSEKEDMVQEGLISLLSAIESFDSEAGVAFDTYATRYAHCSKEIPCAKTFRYKIVAKRPGRRIPHLG